MRWVFRPAPNVRMYGPFARIYRVHNRLHRYEGRLPIVVNVGLSIAIERCRGRNRGQTGSARRLSSEGAVLVTP